jgi:acetyl esterase/lipase
MPRQRGVRGSFRRRSRVATAVGLACIAILSTACTGAAHGQGAAATTSTTGATTSTTGATTSTTVVPAASSEHPYEVLDLRYGDDPAQFVNMYFPGGPGPYPVLFYLHSGGWIAGAKENLPDFLVAQIARAKIALVSVDYRLSYFEADGTPVNVFPIPNQDVDEAIRFVREHAGTWNLDPRMFIVTGASAGGHLAQMAGVDPGEFVSPSLPQDLKRVSPKVEGVMDFVGPSDLVWLIHNAIGFAEGGVVTYLGCPGAQLANCSEALAKEASPQTYMNRRVPPAYFVYGAQDTMIPPDTQGLAIAKPWAEARGDDTGTPPFSHGVYFELAENAGHNLDMTNFDYKTMETWLDSVLAEEHSR